MSTSGSLPYPPQGSSATRLAKTAPIVATLAGASAIGWAPILAVLAARESTLTPTATALWRMTLSLPVLGAAVAWAHWRERVGPKRAATEPRAVPNHWVRSSVLAGVFFAVDLALWHESMSRIAAGLSTLLSNLSVVVVPFVAWLALGERYDRRWAGPTLLALLGAGLIALRPDADTLSHLGVPGGDYWLGNLMAVGTAFAYSGYQVCGARARRHHSALRVLLGSSATSALVLGAIAALQSGPVWPQNARTWVLLSVLAVGSHCGGQGLILWALGKLPAYAVSMLLLWQPACATLLGAVVLGQTLSNVQWIGSSIVLAGLGSCLWLRGRSPLPPAQPPFTQRAAHSGAPR